MPTYRPFTRVADLPANTAGETTILEAHLDSAHDTITDVLEYLSQSVWSTGGVVIAGTVTNPSGAIVRVQGRLGVTSDAKTLVAVADQSVDLDAVTTGIKCLVVIQAKAGASTAHNFTDASTGEPLTHNLLSAWGKVEFVEGNSSDYPSLPDDCVPVAEVTRTGGGLLLDSVLTTAPTLRAGGGDVPDSTKVNINAQTGTTYTLVLADAGKLVTLTNGSAITLTVPTNASVAFPTGTVIALAQGGAGTVTVSPASGVTINSLSSKTDLSGQYATASLTKAATDTWLLSGGLA